MTVSSDVDATYNQEARQRVRAAVTTNPGLGEEFRQRVIYGSDSHYYREFRDKFGIGQKRRPGSQPEDAVGPATAPEAPRERSGSRNGDASLGGSGREKAEGENEADGSRNGDAASFGGAVEKKVEGKGGNEEDGPGSMNE